MTLFVCVCACVPATDACRFSSPQLSAPSLAQTCLIDFCIFAPVNPYDRQWQQPLTGSALFDVALESVLGECVRPVACEGTGTESLLPYLIATGQGTRGRHGRRARCLEPLRV